MADKKESYPMIPLKHWWELRKKFKMSIPKEVSPRYVSSSLNMKESSAKANIIPHLRTVGIIDTEGKPTDRAIKWRDDKEYLKVCEEIKKEIYPSELLDAVPDPKSNQEGAKRWFSNTGVGDVAATKMTAFYQLLVEADPTKESSATSKNRIGKTVKPVKEMQKNKKEQVKTHEKKKEAGEIMVDRISPSIHIDIQIHISPDASPDQVEKIFESMARHLYKGDISEAGKGS